MKLYVLKCGVLAGCLVMAAAIYAQQPAQNPSQPPPAKPTPDQQKPSQSQAPGGNPFPEDTTTVPVLPNANSAAVPDVPASDAGAGVAAPANDSDPARSPDEVTAPATTAAGSESTSSVPNFDKLQPKDDEAANRKLKKGDAPEYKETAGNDIDVGNYELDRHNWKAALSRFQSAMVLNPEDPEAFWGMAEAARHLGDFASARSYYQKVYDYDPDSRHGKEARKALKDPEIANAKVAPAAQPSPQK
jgi:hypothetical protein